MIKLLGKHVFFPWNGPESSITPWEWPSSELWWRWRCARAMTAGWRREKTTTRWRWGDAWGSAWGRATRTRWAAVVEAQQWPYVNWRNACRRKRLARWRRCCWASCWIRTGPGSSEPTWTCPAPAALPDLVTVFRGRHLPGLPATWSAWPSRRWLWQLWKPQKNNHATSES